VVLNWRSPMSSAPPTTDHRAALAEFLRARREALSPSQVGLPAGRARRTPGLRREEVAMLAGVSVTWYTWLEQGRRINASTDVLRAIGRALRLDDAGIDHLAALGQPAPSQQSGDDLYGPDDVPSALRRLIDAFEPAPAYVLGPRWEFAAWNATQARLYPRIDTLAAEDRSLLWVLFADPSTRELIVDWDLHARQALAEFRASTTALRDDPLMVAMIDRLNAASPEFACWWAEHDVARFETRLRRFNHPVAGLLTFEYQLLAPAEWPALTVAVQLPVPGDDSAQRLAVRHHVA
jgi:transcriptional regulator with XRE-family HTH domain